MNMMQFNPDSSLETAMKNAMVKKSDQGKKNKMMMVGQYTSPVQRDGDKEFVVYQHPNGRDQIKVYGNWNEYAVARDDDGRDMIEDIEYPIYMNEDGVFVLDERAMELGEGMDEYEEDED